MVPLASSSGLVVIGIAIVGALLLVVFLLRVEDQDDDEKGVEDEAGPDD